MLVQTANPSEPAIQALIRWDPWHFHRSERARREAAGFPPGFPVFRVAGTAALPDELRALSPVTLLSTAVGEQAVCLVTLRPEALREFRARVVGLAEDGVVTRVEAEPQL